MKKIVALLLSLVMVLASTALLSSCGKSESLVGKWEAGISFDKLLETGRLDDSDETTQGMLKNCDLSGLSFPLIMEFTDKTVTLSSDKDKAAAAMDKFADQIVSGALAYFSEVMASEGTSMTEEELLSTLGMTKEEFKSSITAEMDVDSMISGLADSGESEYEYKDGKLTITDSDGTDTMNVELSGGKFTVLDSLDEEFKVILPIEFKKIG